MSGYYLCVHPGQLILCHATDYLYVIQVVAESNGTLALRTSYCLRRKGAPLPGKTIDAPMVFHPEACSFACWHCLEPREHHVAGKCPFATTRFKELQDA